MTAKYLRLASDIHLDFDSRSWQHLPKYDLRRLNHASELDSLWYPAAMQEDHETILLLPGDLWTENFAFTRRYGGNESWIERLAPRFHSIVLVLGNHDYWDGELVGMPSKARTLIESYGLTNVHLLESSSIVIDDVKLLGGTLWTDFKGGDPMIQAIAPQYMKPDYTYIRVLAGGIYRKLWTSDIAKIHADTRRFIKEHARRDHPEQKVVVLSHHAPSFDSVHEMYRNSSDWNSNYLYFSDLGWDMCAEEFQADLWVHGHMHKGSDYVIDRTRVLCNPRGYQGAGSKTKVYAEQTGFNPTLRLEIAQLTADAQPQLGAIDGAKEEC